MTNSPYVVRRRLPYVEAMQWTGENTEALIQWAQGGWKPQGIWVKQTFPDGATEPAWFLVLPVDLEIPVGGWVVKSLDEQARLTGLTGNLWDTYDPMETRNAA